MELDLALEMLLVPCQCPADSLCCVLQTSVDVGDAAQVGNTAGVKRQLWTTEKVCCTHASPNYM